jgi:hypothetical protein
MMAMTIRSSRRVKDRVDGLSVGFLPEIRATSFRRGPNRAV